MGISKNGGTLNWMGYIDIIDIYWKILVNWMIWGYPHGLDTHTWWHHDITSPRGYSIHEQLTDHDDRLKGLESSTAEQQSRLWPLGSGKSKVADSWSLLQIEASPHRFQMVALLII